MDFIRYQIDTGQVTMIGMCEDDMILFQPVGSDEQIIGGVICDLDLDWVNNGTPEHRPELPISIDKPTFQADGEDEATLSGFPDPCTVIIDGEEHELTGGTLKITSPMAATYTIACHHWPYLDWETTIEAVA